ncbi:MAG: DUF4214 domain-containing protein [Oscillospiraceae bacterium]|nr:DUF4214 domain-containing protein [Oscillospiraceae bacterium]
MENRICAALYEIAEENMRRSGGSFSHPKAAFLYFDRSDPHSVDVLSLLKEPCTNEEFVEIAYLAVLGRPIDAPSLKQWQKQCGMPAWKFRRLVVRNLTASREADLCHKRICHNICRSPRRRKKDMGGFVVKRLLPVYRKLPQGMKNVIRKTMGVDNT